MSKKREPKDGIYTLSTGTRVKFDAIPGDQVMRITTGAMSAETIEVISSGQNVDPSAGVGLRVASELMDFDAQLIARGVLYVGGMPTDRGWLQKYKRTSMIDGFDLSDPLDVQSFWLQYEAFQSEDDFELLKRKTGALSAMRGLGEQLQGSMIDAQEETPEETPEA